MTKLNNELAALGIATLAFGGIAMMTSGPALARSYAGFPHVPATMASGYQSADGSYRSYADFVRDLEGTPCGIECMHDAQSAR